MTVLRLGAMAFMISAAWQPSGSYAGHDSMRGTKPAPEGVAPADAEGTATGSRDQSTAADHASHGCWAYDGRRPHPPAAAGQWGAVSSG
jgi:hypothetical protein